MKIGIFDSGLGGLWVLKHIRELLPDYNYVFFGDQKNVPYGNKSVSELFSYTTKILDYLYTKENCGVVILVCNTTSSNIYSELKEWVQKNYPGRIIFGIVRPTVEFLEDEKLLALFGTYRTIESHIYGNLLSNADDVYEVALPELATIIENGGNTLEYISEFKDSIPEFVETGALVCTHYGIVREDFKKVFPQIKKWIYQEDIAPKYLARYFKEHESNEEMFFRSGTIEIFVSMTNPVFSKFLNKWFVEDLEVKVINL